MKTKSPGIYIRVSCPLCRLANEKFSNKIFNSLEDIQLQAKYVCKCKASINQWYWTERGADNELRICIGNRENTQHPIATLSGTITTAGILDSNKLERFQDKGFELIIHRKLDSR